MHHLSAQHSEHTDGIDRERVASAEEPTKAVWRELNYDAFPLPPEQAKDQPVDVAYEVSTAKRIAQVTVTILACCFASGIVFSFAALKPVLISEGVFRDLCRDESQLNDGNKSACLEQELRLNLFFTIASVTTNVSALPVGTILDRYGPRVCGIAGSVFLAAGSLVLSRSFASSWFNAYEVGNFLLALGGTFIFIPSFQIANAFPRHAGTIVALVTGAFDASAAIFLFYEIAYDATDHAFTPDMFFLVYLIVPLVLLVAQLTLMPANSYQSMPQLEESIENAQDPDQDVHDSDDEIDTTAELVRVRSNRADLRHDEMRKLDELVGVHNERRERAEKEEERHITSQVWGVLHSQPAYKQMRSAWFILITLLTILQMQRMNYFIATIRRQYEYLLDSETQAGNINDFFNVALPVGGIVATPFIGLLLDNVSVPLILTAIVALITLVGILNCLPFVWAGYVTVVLFVLLRPLYYSTMSDYATKVFGFATFGRVYGAIICISGMVNFSQYGLDQLTHGPFNNNPTPINASMTVAGFVVGLALVVFVGLKSRVVRRTQLEEDAEDERERLIPEEARVGGRDEEV
ncbi:hypothetical protein FQN54_002543 [Arachnomyces sp. PD_36]|nr:hypothetical protein FQN54_002543 [Arachnomyces sp. PD_36]